MTRAVLSKICLKKGRMALEGLIQAVGFRVETGDTGAAKMKMRAGCYGRSAREELLQARVAESSG